MTVKPTFDRSTTWRRLRRAANGLGDVLATPRGASPGRTAAP